ncbi:uncharacterized protein EDB91DRAFT_1087465 [Suillus paluster]|uniref:uncharacterized protein n=1 Tax=Suillus paluster TaxID=48578 RepID=UPI001B879700|nr:uncharacterized protein EDB91DRAFT_1087465 [Suillus paluster]KAG1724455.1 hypothetical protein EDB91DRAFT_1087465 [Suillus paluster]
MDEFEFLIDLDLPSYLSKRCQLHCKTGLCKRAQLSSEDSEPESLHSNALDDPPPKKRTRSSNFKYKSSLPSKPKPRKCKAKEDDAKDEEDVDGSDLDLKEGQQVVGRIVQAPKTGWVPPGQVSQNTLDFLMQLKDPACNDREWFKLHEPVYRRIEKEFKGFKIKDFTNMLRVKPGDESVIAAAVSCRFMDAQVIAPGAEFMDALRGVADVMMPFVHCLNDMMTLPADDGSDGENEEDDTGGPEEDESDDVVE